MLIYALFDSPTPDVIRYVGQTRLTLRQRIANHVRRSETHTHHSACWIRSVEEAGRRVEGRILVIVEPSEADETERRIIALFRSRGWSLTNTTDGGEAGKVYSDEARQRMSDSAKARCTPDWRAEASRGATGRTRTAEDIEKWRVNNIGKHAMSDRHKLIMSAVQTGRQRSPEELEKQRQSHLGQVFTDETRQKISDGVLRAWERRRAQQGA